MAFPSVAVVHVNVSNFCSPQHALRSDHQCDVRVAFYHAALSPQQREQVQHAWTHSTTQILCATIAFGMGECCS